MRQNVLHLDYYVKLCIIWYTASNCALFGILHQVVRHSRGSTWEQRLIWYVAANCLLSACIRKIRSCFFQRISPWSGRKVISVCFPYKLLSGHCYRCAFERRWTFDKLGIRKIIRTTSKISLREFDKGEFSSFLLNNVWIWKVIYKKTHKNLLNSFT